MVFLTDLLRTCNIVKILTLFLSWIIVYKGIALVASKSLNVKQCLFLFLFLFLNKNEDLSNLDPTMPSKCSRLSFKELDYKTKRRSLNGIHHYVITQKITT